MDILNKRYNEALQRSIYDDGGGFQRYLQLYLRNKEEVMSLSHKCAMLQFCHKLSDQYLQTEE